MRHGIAGNRLSRNRSLRKATLRDLAKATLIHQRICTTKAKAKEARRLVDQLITMGKKGTLAHKRRAFAILCDHGLVSELFNKTAPRFANRAGGYTRIISLSNRRGDNAQLALLELTEKDKVIITGAKKTVEAKSTPSVKDSKKVADKDDVIDVSNEAKETSKKHHSVKDKEPAKVDQPKKGKTILGGVQKMFQRKTGSGQ